MSQSRLEQTKNISGKRNNGLPLQTRLVLFVLIVALVPLIIIATRDTLQTQQALTNGAEISLKAGAAQTANSLDNFIQKTLDSIGAEAKLNDLVTFLSLSQAARTGTVVRERTLGLLNNLIQKDSLNIISYALVDSKGNVLLDSATDTQYNEAEEPYFKQTQFSATPIVSYVTYEEDKTTSLIFASAIVDNNGTHIGVLRVKFRSAVLQDVIIKSVGTSTDASVLLLDQLNIRMADTRNPDLVLKSIVPLNLVDYLQAVDTRRFLNIPREEQATNLIDFAYALDTAKEQPFFRVDISPDIPGDDTIAVAFMETQPWIVTYSRPTSIFLAEVQNQTRTNIILVISISVIISIITAVVARNLTNPIITLTKTANSISMGNLNARAEVNTTDEIGLLASAFNSMTDQLQSTLVGLEQRVYERTAELQKNKLELETIADVTREIAIIRDMDTLLNVSANLIQERLKYYHVGIFLIDERGEYALLRAASSVAAEKMLASKYKLRVGKTGLVGNVTSTGQAYIALDVGSDAVHFENPYLPGTRSEIALPLRSYSITIGALDIQASIPNAFNQQDVQTLQILADQLAAAIENAQLVHQVEGTLNELTRSNRTQTQHTWQNTIDERNVPTYEYDGLQINAIPQNLAPELLAKLADGKPIIIPPQSDQLSGKSKIKGNTLLIPLMVLNQVVGVIGLEQEDPSHKWTDEEIAIAQAAASRAALTLENSRLLEESQRRASKERTILESTARVGSAINIENILQATAEELERVLGDSEVVLQFNTGIAPSGKDN